MPLYSRNVRGIILFVKRTPLIYITHRKVKRMPQTCRRSAADLRRVCGILQIKSAAKRMSKYAAERNFAADLEQSAADLRQNETLLQTCRIPLCRRNRSAADLRQNETLLQTCRILVCRRKSLRQIYGRMKLCCRLAAYHYIAGTDLRQICGRMKLCSRLAAYSLRQGYRRPFWRTMQPINQVVP